MAVCSGYENNLMNAADGLSYLKTPLKWSWLCAVVMRAIWWKLLVDLSSWLSQDTTEMIMAVRSGDESNLMKAAGGLVLLAISRHRWNDHGCALWWWEQLDESCWRTCPLSYLKTPLKCMKKTCVYMWAEKVSWMEPGQPFFPRDDVGNHAASQRPVRNWQCAAAHVRISAAVRTVRSCLIAVFSWLYVSVYITQLSQQVPQFSQCNHNFSQLVLKLVSVATACHSKSLDQSM